MLMPDIQVMAMDKLEEIYVSVNGSDILGDGTLQNPVASISGAKSLAREKLKNHVSNIHIKFLAGVYPIENVEFDSEDSGTSASPVIYEAYDDGNVIFSGAKKLDISDFETVKNPEILLRIPQSARGKVLYYNLEKSGINCSAYSTYDNLLYADGFEQTQGRYPNKGYIENTEIISNNIIRVNDERVRNWTNAKEAVVVGSIGGSYFWEQRKVKSINDDALTLDYGVTNSNVSLYIKNLLEEIDMPGEYYVDRRENVLYYYPPENVSELSITTYVGVKDIIKLNECKNIVFDGLKFEKTGGNQIVYATNAENLTIKNCSFNYCQNNVLYISGKNCLISGNTAYGCYGGFAKFAGGDPVTLTDSGLVFENNRISSCGRRYRYINAIFQSGENSYGAVPASIGSIIRNNIIGDCGTTYAITVPGNNNKILNNEIYNQAKHIIDGGSVYFGRCNSKYGNSVTNNYFHDFSDKVYAGVYSDDGFGGLTVENNVFQNVFEGIKAGMGMNNEFNNNLFINCDRGLRLQTRMFSAENKTFGDEGAFFNEVSDALENYPAFHEKYPDLQKSLLRKPYFAPYNSCVTGNVSIGNGKLLYAMPAHSYMVDGTLRITGEDKVEGISDAMNASGYVNEMKLYGKKITDADGNDLNSTSAGNPSFTYSDAYFANAVRGDYTPSNALIEKASSISDIDMSRMGIESGKNKIAFEYDKTVKLLYPANEQQNVDAQTTLCWGEVQNSSKYTVTVSENQDMSEPILCEKISENANTNAYDISLEKGKTYYWQIKAHGISRQDSFEVVSEIYSFTTVNQDGINSESFLFARSIAEKELEEIEAGIISYTNATDVKEIERLAEITLDGKTQTEIDAAENEILSSLSTIMKNRILQAPGILKCSFEENSGMVVVEGGIAAANEPVSIIVLNRGYDTIGDTFSMDTIRYIDIVNSDSDGYFKFSFSPKRNEFDMPGVYKVTITYGDGKRFESEYSYGSISLGEATFKDSGGQNIATDDLTQYAGKVLTAEISVTNRLAKDITPVVIAAIYKNRKVIGVHKADTDLLDKNSTRAITTLIPLSNSFDSQCEIKLMLFNDLQLIKPMTTAKIIYN